MAPETGDSWQVTQRLAAAHPLFQWFHVLFQFPYISINAIYIHHRLLSGPFEAFGTAHVQNVYC